MKLEKKGEMLFGDKLKVSNTIKRASEMIDKSVDEAKEKKNKFGRDEWWIRSSISFVD